MFKKEAEDELIPVATLPEKDRRRIRFRAQMRQRRLRAFATSSAVAKSGDRQAHVQIGR